MSAQLSKPGTSSTVRTFLAVELPDSLKVELSTLQTFFAGDASPLKWTAPRLLHITVRFLGNMRQTRLPDVEAAARAGAGQTTPFTLQLSGLGAFPNEHSPRVIWVGLEHDAGYAELQKLFSFTEDALSTRGFGREERAFAPHVTLARTRENASRAEMRAIGENLQKVKAHSNIQAHWRVQELVVMRSDLSVAGPKYTPLAAVPLSADG